MAKWRDERDQRPDSPSAQAGGGASGGGASGGASGGTSGGGFKVDPNRLPELSIDPSVEWGADVAAAARQCSQGSELACYALGKCVRAGVRA